MSVNNGEVDKQEGEAATRAARTADDNDIKVPTFGESTTIAKAIEPPPEPRFTLPTTLKLARALVVLPLGLWVLLAIPRAIEITGAAEGGGGAGGEGLFVGVMLAAISIIVSLLAVIVTMFSHSDIADRILVEREAAEALKGPKAEAEVAAVAAAEERNRAFGATDALPGTYTDQLRAIEDSYFERFYLRHAENPEVYGTWDEKTTLQTRFKDSFADLFNTPNIMTPDELKQLIEGKRSERANFRDTRVNTDG